MERRRLHRAHAINSILRTACRTFLRWLAACIIVASAAGGAAAEDRRHSAEYWLGVEGFRDVLSFYGGVTWAPGGDLTRSGFRVRASGAFSRYEGAHAFTVVRQVGNNVVEETSIEPVDGQKASARGLLGWQWQSGPLTIKAFAGIAYGGEKRVSTTTGAKASGYAVGAAAALDLWYDMSPALWSSLDLAYAVPDGEAFARARLGLRLNDRFSIGPEVAWTGTTQGHLARAGLFVRYDNGISEISVSLDAARTSDGRVSPFIAAQWLQRF